MNHEPRPTRHEPAGQTSKTHFFDVIRREILMARHSIMIYQGSWRFRVVLSLFFIQKSLQKLIFFNPFQREIAQIENTRKKRAKEGERS